MISGVNYPYEVGVTTPPEPLPSDGPQQDSQLLEQVYQEHIQDVYRFLYKRVGNKEDAEDLCAQVFLKAVRHLDPAYSKLSIQSWLFQLARTALADYWRLYYKNPRAPLEQAAVEEVEPSNPEREVATAEMLRQVMSRLPAHYRKVLTLRFLERRSIRESAAEMGISEANVKVLQLRALRKAAEVGKDLL